VSVCRLQAWLTQPRKRHSWVCLSTPVVPSAAHLQGRPTSHTDLQSKPWSRTCAAAITESDKSPTTACGRCYQRGGSCTTACCSGSAASIDGTCIQPLRPSAKTTHSPARLAHWAAATKTAATKTSRAYCKACPAYYHTSPHTPSSDTLTAPPLARTEPSKPSITPSILGCSMLHVMRVCCEHHGMLCSILACCDTSAVSYVCKLPMRAPHRMQKGIPSRLEASSEQGNQTTKAQHTLAARTGHLCAAHNTIVQKRTPPPLT
jgi:hypothetical protein